MYDSASESLALASEADRLLAADRAELALFAAWAVHDQSGREAQRVIRETVRAVEATADPALRETFVRAMLSMLGDSLLAFVREMLMNPQLIPESPGAQALRLELEARGEARALLAVLGARGIAVDHALRERIARCTDGDVLTRWIARAATAATAQQVFVDEP